jgi:hypothetical protein
MLARFVWACTARCLAAIIHTLDMAFRVPTVFSLLSVPPALVVWHRHGCDVVSQRRQWLGVGKHNGFVLLAPVALGQKSTRSSHNRLA